MVTDDERRAVAERLRGLKRNGHNVTQLNHGPTWSIAWCVLGNELEDCVPQDWFERMCARLADLIEPCDMSQSCRDTVACGIDSIYDWCFAAIEGADGPEDKLFCAIMSAIEDYRHPERVTARTVRPVDRESLLALADCVRKMGEGYDKVSSFALGTTFRAIADRIREACGEVTP